MGWPASREELEHEQERLAREAGLAQLWRPAASVRVGSVFAAAPRGLSGRGAGGDPAWAAAVSMEAGKVLASAILPGRLAAAYEPGFLALRQGPLLEAALNALQVRPDVLLVNATGTDHPRRAGLALHLGAVLELPSIGVTDRPLLPEAERLGLARPLAPGGDRPIWVSAGWRTDLETAAALVASLSERSRTPEPLREARRLARTARAAATRPAPGGWLPRGRG
jgi:deoxyribonuclease V